MKVDIPPKLASKLAQLASNNGYILEEYVEHLLTKIVADLDKKSECTEQASCPLSNNVA